MRAGSFSAALAAAVAVCSSPASALSPVVSLPNSQGDVVGTCSASECVWKGIPFGEDTSGPNRFVAPVPKAPWSAPLNATADAPGCISIHHNPDTAKVQSEDCLNLNVYAPASATAGAKLPVYVFLYGGSFTEGSNYGPFDMYQGRGFTRNDVILVAPNYRLGAYAFLVTDKLSGNVGLLDQRLALKWVQDNIEVFGGDASRVTLGGESAGAMSVGYHLVSPGSWPYFQAAIMESNPSALLPRPNDRARLYGVDFCEILGCQSLLHGCDTQCIQAAPAANVSEAWKKSAGNDIVYVLANWGHLLDGMLDFKPTVDGEILPMGSVAAVMADKWARDKPVLLGSNTAEGVAFIGSMNVNELEFAAAVELLFAGKPTKLVEEILLRYGPEGKFNGTLALSAVFTDYWFRCATEQFANAAQRANQSAFVYRYDHLISVPTLWPHFGLPALCETNVCHAAELPIVFDLHQVRDPLLNITLTPEEAQLSADMDTYWTAFIKGDYAAMVSAAGDTWPAWDSSKRENLVIDTKFSTETSISECADLWDKIGYTL